MSDPVRCTQTTVSIEETRFRSQGVPHPGDPPEQPEHLDRLAHAHAKSEWRRARRSCATRASPPDGPSANAIRRRRGLRCPAMGTDLRDLWALRPGGQRTALPRLAAESEEPAATRARTSWPGRSGCRRGTTTPTPSRCADGHRAGSRVRLALERGRCCACRRPRTPSRPHFDERPSVPGSEARGARRSTRCTCSPSSSTRPTGWPPTGARWRAPRGAAPAARDWDASLLNDDRHGARGRRRPPAPSGVPGPLLHASGSATTHGPRVAPLDGGVVAAPPRRGGRGPRGAARPQAELAPSASTTPTSTRSWSCSVRPPTGGSRSRRCRARPRRPCARTGSPAARPTAPPGRPPGSARRRAPRASGRRSRPSRWPAATRRRARAGRRRGRRWRG